MVVPETLNVLSLRYSARPRRPPSSSLTCEIMISSGKSDQMGWSFSVSLIRWRASSESVSASQHSCGRALSDFRAEFVHSRAATNLESISGEHVTGILCVLSEWGKN